MSPQLLRVLMDIELISALAIASGLIIAAGIDDIKSRQTKSNLHETAPADPSSVKSIYKDFELVTTSQITSGLVLARSTFAGSILIFKIIETYTRLIVLTLPVYLAYISYEAIRFHTGFLVGVAWASLSGFMLLAIIANRTLPAWRRLRLVILDPAIFWPFILLSVVWSLAVAKSLVKSTGIFFMEAKVIPGPL